MEQQMLMPRHHPTTALNRMLSQVRALLPLETIPNQVSRRPPQRKALITGRRRATPYVRLPWDL